MRTITCCAKQEPLWERLVSGLSLSLPNSSRFTFIQETLSRLVPPDGKQCWYSWYLAVTWEKKRQVFGYVVDRKKLDEVDESENNRVCIFRLACLGAEEESDSLCLSLKEFFFNGENR